MELPELPSLALSLEGFAAEAGPRQRITAAAELGYRSVTLDAKAPGLRARELDRSARRDLAATLRRAELRLAGLDLWIPLEHFASSEHADRAVAAAIAATELLSELAALVPADEVLSVVLPPEGGEEASRAIAAAAERSGVLIADHAWPLRTPVGALVRGLDAAAALAQRADPSLEAGGASVVCARLNSVGDGGLRLAVDAPGSRLDVDAYRAGLSVAGSLRTIVADVRGTPEPQAAASAALDAWNNADPFSG